MLAIVTGFAVVVVWSCFVNKHSASSKYWTSHLWRVGASRYTILIGCLSLIHTIDRVFIYYIATTQSTPVIKHETYWLENMIIYGVFRTTFRFRFNALLEISGDMIHWRFTATSLYRHYLNVAVHLLKCHFTRYMDFHYDHWRSYHIFIIRFATLATLNRQ